MGNIGALLRQLESRRMAAPRRDTPRWIFAAFSIFLFLYTLSCAISAGELVRALHAGGWSNLPLSGFGWNDFIGGIGEAFIAALQLTLIVVRARTDVPRWQIFAAAGILRFVAVGNDESLAPEATWLLDGLRKEPVPAVPAQFEPLPSITTESDMVWSLTGGTLCIVGFLLAGTGLFMALSPDPDLAMFRALWSGIGIAGVVTLLVGIICLRIGWRAKRPLTVSADQNGLRWTPSGRGAKEMQISWRYARAFFLIQYSDTETGAGRHVAFVVDAPDATLIWDERTSNKPEVLGVSDSLCALILARTGLPLRELTGIAGKLSSPRWKPAFASLPAAFWQPLPGDDPTAPTLPAPATRWKLARPVFYATLPLFLILAVLGVVGWSLPH